MKKNIIDDERMMLRVSDLYYNHRLGQQDIALKLGISRPTISKLLKAARDVGIVQITVSDINGRKHYQMEQHLEEKFGLKEVFIVESKEDSLETKESIGEAAATFLSRIIKEGDTIGVSMGTTVASIAPHAHGTYHTGLTFLPLVGGIGTVENDLHSNYIAESLAKAFGGYYFPIHAPAMVSRIKTKTELMKENSIRRVFKKASHLDIALVGIGIPSAHSTMIKTGYFTPEMLAELKTQNICGDICMNFYDESGDIDRYEYNEKVIGINITALRQVSHSIGVCCGAEKGQAIHGAINGGFINVLITDYNAALALDSI
ncbi:sugar-binding transcriptional regulator [Eubacterium sp.]|uniref:sugar-binding transcriptional regulator n=1 Tax=Eubacterium sp. TaxID=142586 RepID=UPI002FCB475E